MVYKLNGDYSMKSARERFLSMSSDASKKKKERVDGTSQCKSQRVLQASFALNVLESLSLPSYFL